MKMNYYNKSFSGLTPVQLQDEFSPLLHLIAGLDINSYLEVGVGRGDTFHEVSSVLPKGSLCVAVDKPASAWGFSDSQKMLERAVADVKANGREAHLIIGCSQDASVVAQAKDFGEFDLVFIDGDHTYEGVKADFDNYTEGARYVVLHDIAAPPIPNAVGEVIEVARFWDEIKTQYRYIEFIDNGAQYPMGIGVLFMDEPTC